ncbi:J domain-containing protein [Leptospira sp. GIMC2001]|uniref:J domain-containing protein n=1 Tax=Leptospira sp. GIMC2001 TaxID=1513297 RepID=UPI0023499FC0|nr:J domain-containing protein [Leptospira sp. GIMC2001]WCL50939.1 J domain-containing protein [Leptospira sp. GIMC2001]
MEEEDLLVSSLDFFGLNPDFTEDEFREKFRDLAKKFHPDTGEYTSSILFNELTRSKSVLESYLANRSNIQDEISINKSQPIQEAQVSKAKKIDPSYEIYKLAKEKENLAIIEYFDQTKGNNIFLSAEENPPLRELIRKLHFPITSYQRILDIYPESIWASDASDSLKRLSKWTKHDSLRQDDGVGRT